MSAIHLVWVLILSVMGGGVIVFAIGLPMIATSMVIGAGLAQREQHGLIAMLKEIAGAPADDSATEASSASATHTPSDAR